MIAAAPDTHVRVDKSGVAWIDDTNVRVVDVIINHLTHGHSPEEVHLQHPHPSLAQIYSASAYYFDHRAEMDAEIERRRRGVEAMRVKATHQPARKKRLARLNKQ